MSSTIFLTALLLTATPDEAEAPKDELRGLVKKLTEAPEAPAKKRAKAVAAADDEPETHTNAAPAAFTGLKKDSGASSHAGLALGGLAIALAVALFAAKGRAKPQRPLRRLAAETIGARQQIVLVEALGEYLLVATGGKEPVLLAQLDREQAQARLAAMQGGGGSDEDNKILGGILDKLKKKPEFESLLGAAEKPEKTDKVQAPLPAELAPAPDAEILRAQAALRSLAQNRAAIGTIAPKRVPAPKLARSPAHGRTDEIRRRLNSI